MRLGCRIVNLLSLYVLFCARFAQPPNTDDLVRTAFIRSVVREEVNEGLLDRDQGMATGYHATPRIQGS